MTGQIVLSRALGVLRVASIAFPLLASVIWGALIYRDARLSGVEHARTQAQLVAQHVETVIEAQRVLHRAIAARLAVERADFIATAEFGRYLHEVTSAQPSLDRLQVIGPDGQVRADSQSFPPRPVADMPKAADPVRQGAALWIDRHLSGGADHLLVATPLGLPDGQGVMLSWLATQELQSFLKGIAVREGEAASLARADGMLLLRNFTAPPTLLPAEAPGRTLPMVAREGSFVTRAVTDGITRVYAFHWGIDLPVFANFGVPMALVMQDFVSQALPLFALFILMGLFMWVTASRVRRSLTERLAAEESRKRAEAAEALAEQRIHLMREMNHRVKNNLALVNSLINLQSRGAAGLDAEELKARIGAISHVHDLMHQAADAVHVDFGRMLADLAASPAIVPRESGINLRTELQPGILLGPDRSTPLSVVAAELITNAVKHAFPERPGGTIRIRLYREGAGVVLEVADDGIGFPAKPARHSGNAIIEALVEQVGGVLTRQSGPGLSTVLRFSAE